MESTVARQAPQKVANPAITAGVESHLKNLPARSNPNNESRPAGYGMPCANCRAYYPSDMQACPICKSKERISATSTPKVGVTPAPPQSEEARLLAVERERLRELKSQIYASHAHVSPAPLRCALDQNHDGDMEPAAVCHTCYGEARQQADRLEAALHMDAKEAAKIVYDAVWADPSDPNKTYLNAANALLMELRRRAGVGLLLGSNQPLPH